MGDEIAQLPSLPASKSLPASQLRAIREGVVEVEKTAAKVIDAVPVHPIPQSTTRRARQGGKSVIQLEDDW